MPLRAPSKPPRKPSRRRTLPGPPLRLPSQTAAQEDARQAFEQQASDEGVRDSYNKALQAARSASAGGNAAFAAESDTEEDEAEPKEEAEVGGSEAANADVEPQSIGRSDASRDEVTGSKETADEAKPGEDTPGEVGSSAVTVTPSPEGGVPRFALGAGALLVTGGAFAV
jgi:hypothetical protein